MVDELGEIFIINAVLNITHSGKTEKNDVFWPFEIVNHGKDLLACDTIVEKCYFLVLGKWEEIN